MIAQEIQGHVSQASWNKIITKKKWFTWYESSGHLYDGALIIKIIMDFCNLETKFGVQSLRDKIYETRSACFRHNMTNIPDTLEHIKITIDLIECMCGTDDNLLKDVFDTLLKAPNTRFNHFFVHEKLL